MSFGWALFVLSVIAFCAFGMVWTATTQAPEPKCPQGTVKFFDRPSMEYRCLLVWDGP